MRNEKKSRRKKKVNDIVGLFMPEYCFKNIRLSPYREMHISFSDVLYLRNENGVNTPRGEHRQFTRYDDYAKKNRRRKEQKEKKERRHQFVRKNKHVKMI